MGKFMIIFPRQITAEQIGFSFEYLLARIIFAVGRTFQNLGKTLKIYLPSTPNVRRTRNRPVPGLQESSSGEGWYRRVEVQG